MEVAGKDRQLNFKLSHKRTVLRLKVALSLKKTFLFNLLVELCFEFKPVTA
jgi:hypothetical protein